MSARAPLFYDRAVELCARAVALDDSLGGGGDSRASGENGAPSETTPASPVRLYAEACEYFLAGYRLDTNSARRALVLSRVRQFIARAEALKAADVVALRSRSAPAGVGARRAVNVEAGGGTAQRRERRRFHDSGFISKKKSGGCSGEEGEVRFSDVVGLECAKQELVQSVILPQRQPQLFAGARAPHAGILLYGPPGTGKTMLAKALATEARCAFLSVSSADIMSKFQGDSERAVRALFEKARAQAPCVIFIDEVDSLGRARVAGEKASQRRVKTELLQQMDGLLGSGNGSDGVVVLGASNTPWELDAALRRRFQRRIYTPLPARHERAQIMRLAMEGTRHALRDRDYARVAARTEGFSSSDMSTLAREALMGPVRRCLRSTHFRQVKRWDAGASAAAATTTTTTTTTAIEPCGRWDLGARQVDIWSPSFDPMRLQAPPVMSADLADALRTTKSSVGAEDLARCAAFTERFGSRGTGAAAAAAAGSTSSAAAPPAAPAPAASGGILGFFKGVFGWGGDPEQLPVAPTAHPSAAAAGAGRPPRLCERREEETVLVQERVSMLG